MGKFSVTCLTKKSQLSSQKATIEYLCTNVLAQQVYPRLSRFAKLCRVIPIHTASVERTFSQLKFIKTRIRNRMNERSLDALLRIAIEAPDKKRIFRSKKLFLFGRQRKIDEFM